MIRLAVEKRKSVDGSVCVVPFINGWNVWNLFEHEWTQNVQMALLHAYRIGVCHALEEVVSAKNDIRSKLTVGSVSWKETP